MPDRGWKALERRIAADLGGKRIPVTGERHGADVECPMFSVQVKNRKALPSWLWGWLAGIVARASSQRKIGLLILKTPRMRDTDGLVVLRYGDWVQLHGSTLRESETVDAVLER